MYPVSQAFLNAVKANTRKYYWTGRITTTVGTVYNFDQEDMVKGSGYITSRCCGSTEIELGTVYASAFTVRDSDTKIITIEFATKDDINALFFGQIIVDVTAPEVTRTANAFGNVVIPAVNVEDIPEEGEESSVIGVTEEQTLDELEFMDEDERREALEEAGYDSDDFEDEF